jgi:hypothetical protein
MGENITCPRCGNAPVLVGAHLQLMCPVCWIPAEQFEQERSRSIEAAIQTGRHPDLPWKVE